jgi:hypothetical protein
MRLGTGYGKCITLFLLGILLYPGVANPDPAPKVTFRLADVPPRSSTDLNFAASLAVMDEFFRRHPEYD